MQSQTEIFNVFLNRRVYIEYKEYNTLISGVLKSIDGYLNLFIEDVDIEIGTDKINMKHCMLRGIQVDALKIK